MATQNAADDDRETQAKSSEGQTEDVGPTSNNPANASANGTASGSQVSPGSIGTKGTYIQPGRRLKNPLASFASSTYQLTLYMITPDAYEAFIQSGRKRIQALESASGVSDDSNFSNRGQAGAYIIAQSGGINNSVTQRAPGFELDYYIDNLKIITATNAKSTQTASNTTNVTFEIIEPYGFSFISNLKRAGAALQEYNQSTSYKNLANATKQFFMLGVRFYGYDINGNLLTGKESLYGDIVDASGSENGVFEQFYDIVLTSVKFRLDGTATRYMITAAATSPQAAMGLKRGIVQQRTTVEGRTVIEVLKGEKGLFTRLNEQQQELAKDKKITYANEYDVAWVGDFAYEKIGLASIVLPSDLDKSRFPGANVKSTTESTDALGVAAVPNTNKRVITINSAATVLQVISQIIAQSSYLEDALKVVYTATLEPDPKQGSPKEITPDTNKTVSWYNVSVEISNPRWDPLTQDWAYKMTYVFQIYDTPVITNPYTNAGENYYGPHKRYQYWFGGQNSEIIQYSQEFDNLYFNIALDGLPSKLVGVDGTNPATEEGAGGVNTSGGRTGGDITGKPNVGMEAQNAYVTSLYDPGAYATAKMKILGDPDFLVRESTSSLNTVYNKFYGTDGFTVSANGGQVFVEVDFKEAVDYKNSNGLLNINDSIQFWPYPNSLKDKIQGVSYMVTNVVSTFVGGRFEQDLTMVIPSFYDPNNNTEQDQGRAEDELEEVQVTGRRGQLSGETTGIAPSDTTATTGNSGLIPDPDLSKVITQPTQLSLEANLTQQTTTSLADGVADDDSGPTATNDIENDQRIDFDGTNYYDSNGNIIPPPGT